MYSPEDVYKMFIPPLVAIEKKRSNKKECPPED
jgi:hypothetical protein